MKPMTLLLGALLGISLIVNAMALSRLSRQETKPASPSKWAPQPTGDHIEVKTPEPAPPTGDPKVDAVLRELAQVRRDIAELRSAIPAGKALPASTPSGTTPKDPAVAEILDEADRLNKFWGDMNKLAMARDQLDETKYMQTVLDETANFLGLVDPARSAFTATARAAFSDYDRARKEMQEAQKAINWKEDPKGAQDQYQALNARYRETVNAANERVKGQLDLTQPRQKQFSTKLETWMGYAGGSWGGGKRW